MKGSTVALFLVAAAIVFTAPTPALAADACKNVKFRVTNNHNSGKTIIVKRVKYFNKASGSWHTEVVNQGVDTKGENYPWMELPFGWLERNPGLICRHGAECITSGDNLSGVEGQPLTKFRFIIFTSSPATGPRVTRSGPTRSRALTRNQVVRPVSQIGLTVAASRAGRYLEIEDAPTRAHL